MTDIQKVILEIFKEVDKLCRENNIRYYAIGGTCIGAARHKGFIPWDDDLDIAIPIEDYEKFLNLARTGLPSHLKVYTCKNVKHYSNLFSKVIDERTTFIENSQIAYSDSYKGVFIDIMPLGGIPSDEALRNKFYKKIAKYSKLNILKRDKKSTVKRRLYGIISWILFLFPYNYFSNKIYELYEKNPVNNSDFVGYVWSYKRIRRLTFPKQFFAESVDLPFEDTVISCPIGYHEYLTQQFGDYMVIPQGTEQITHNGIVDLDKSYKWYQSNRTWRKKRSNEKN